MGALYLACQGDPGLEKLCVIKTVLPTLADKEYVARFRDEAKVVVRLQHGNLVPVFDAGIAKGLSGEEMYLAMEHVDGKDLRAVWNRCAKKGIAFPVDVAVYIARELCRGLHHAHTFSSLKLVHRDVSPPNVLVSFFGEVKLTDFGLASSTQKTEKTAPGVVYGKVSYMSPEQARGEALDGRTDLFAVGIILWELLTGRQLFPQSEPSLIDRVRDPDITSPSQLAPRVAPALDAIVMKALAKDRTLRYADCEAFRAALAGFLAATAPTTDTERVQTFMAQLFDEEIEDERQKRQQQLDDASRSRAAKVQAAVEPKQTQSQPETISLAPKEPPKSDSSILGTYIDDRYLIKKLIGEGGMGLVYEAEHVEIGRRVAVKVLHAMYTRQSEVVARFRSEARAATRIGHPHIIDVFDSGTTVDGAVYFVMEYLEGRDLAHLIHELGKLPPQRSIVIAREICQALAAAHKAGILHRDLKPENVYLVRRDGNDDFVKVLDFGIAKTLDAVTDRVGRLTNPGIAMGTPEYMAPEQAAGQPVDARADVYSVGAILYEMLSGQPPHDGTNIMEILTHKATRAPVPLSTLRPDVPKDLERLIMRTLAISPELRPQSMVSMADELARLGGIVSATNIPAVAPTSATDRLPRTRAPYVAGAVALAVIVGGAAAVVLATRGPHSPAPLAQSPAPSSESSRSAAAASPSAEPKAASSTAPAPTTIGQAPSAPPTAAQPSSATAQGPASAHSAAPTAALAMAAHHDDKPAAKLITVNKAVVLKPPVDPMKTAPSPPSPALAQAEAKKKLKSAREALMNGNLAEAETLYTSVLTAGVERPTALTGLASVAFQQGNFLLAVRQSKRALEAGGGVEAKMVLGNSYFRLGKYDDAIGQYREVLALDHGHREAADNLAAAEKRKGI
jgi:serine/threonine protein kinase/Flp pilus assembly protein TadD